RLCFTLIVSGMLPGMCGTLLAQRAGTRTQFGIGGGVVMPSGDFRNDGSGDGYKTGWQGLILVEVRQTRNRIGLRFNGSFGENASNAQLNADASASFGQPTTRKVRIVSGMVDVTLNPQPGRFRSRGAAPYLLGGAGAA